MTRKEEIREQTTPNEKKDPGLKHIGMTGGGDPSFASLSQDDK
jgi:hypothetical protein